MLRSLASANTVFVLGCVAAACCAAVRARAQDAPKTDGAPDASYGTRARVLQPMAASNPEDPTASGTQIDTTQREAAHESVSDVLLEVPGARPYRTGYLGSFTSASLRGAEIEHTAVLLGDIPISSADAAAFDLSTIPVSVLDDVTVYRGGAPVWLSQGAIGGVIVLTPRTAHGTSLGATATGGSFGTLGLSTQSSIVPNDPHALQLTTSAGVLGASGDFPVHFDNKTALDPSDDYVMRRNDADFVAGHALLHLRQPIGPGALELVLLGFSRTGGEPGSPADPANTARRAFKRGTAGVSYTLEQTDAQGQRRLRLQALVSTSMTRSTFTDLNHELVAGGGPFRSDDLTLGVFGRLAGTVAVTDFLDLTLIGSGQHDDFQPDESFAQIQLPDSARDTVTGALETNLHGKLADRQIELRPSLRLEHTNVALSSSNFKNVAINHDANTLATYRAALAFEVVHNLTLSGSAASGARTPSLLELFGDGALIDGNTALQPERSTSYDVGLTSVTKLGDLSGSFELRGFDLSTQDQILYVRNSFAHLLPLNLTHSHVQGIELGARTTFGTHLWLNGAATFLATEGKPGKRLPNRPRATFFVQPGVMSNAVGPFDALHAFVEASYIASSYDDPDNATQPKRAEIFFDLGGALFFWRKQCELRVTVNDLFDRRGQDLRKFPLPGRTVLASLTYNEDLL